MLILLASCGTHKDYVNDNGGPKVITLTSEDVMKKVIGQKVTAENIVGDMTFTINTGDNEISVPASLHMRKDQTIRIQLFVPILGTELGRLEFTPEHVLIINRMQKEYVKANYSDVSFLNNNGISFYSLQALFWNQLMLLGKHDVTMDDAERFSAGLTESKNLTLTTKEGNLSCCWTISPQTSLINEALLDYRSSVLGTSSLKWTYSDFRNVGQKKFPSTQSFNISTTAGGKKQAVVTLNMNDVKTDSKWEATTNVSSKYKKVSVEDLLSKLLSM